MKAGFWKFGTAGNTTLFVTDQEVLPDALGTVSAEQAGYLDFGRHTLEMAGGEMCVNACLACAPYGDATGHPVHETIIGGMRIKTGANGKLPHWQAWASFPANICLSETNGGIRIIHLPGISHALIGTDEFLPEGSALSEAAHLRANLGLESRLAAGIVWWRQNRDAYEIQPVVSVPKAGTCNLEMACGSGSIALVLTLPAGSHKIIQPSGEVLTVVRSEDLVTIQGTVDLLAQGTLWL